MTENQSAPEAAQTSAPETTTSAPSATTSTAPTSGSGTQSMEATPTPAYQPNFKFKAWDQEYEIDEMYRGLIKDQETEKKIKELHSKAFGLEKMQAERDKVRQVFEEFKSKHDPDLRAMGYFNNLLQNKDWDNFFKGLKVPEDEIFNWVAKRLELMKMPQDQRAEFDRQAQIRQENYRLQQEMSQQQQTYQEQMVQTRIMMLDQLSARPDIAQKAAMIDQKMGSIGAFRNLIVEEGVSHFHRTGQDLTPEQAVDKVLKKFGGFLGDAPAMSPGMSTQPVPQAPPSIIPHVAGRGTSPVKKRPTSLEDIKNLAKNL